MTASREQRAKILTADFGGGPALLPPGEYQLGFKRYELSRRFQRGVLELWFIVTDYGPHFGLLIPRYYNVQLSAKMRNFRARPQSAFCKEYCQLFGRRPKPIGTAALADFRAAQIVGVVATVKTDCDQKPLPKAARYSVIRELVRVV